MSVENALAGDPILDLAKTDLYWARGDEGKREALLAGYGELPGSWRERLGLYRLYHALELWDWYAEVGAATPLDELAGTMRRMCEQ